MVVVPLKFAPRGEWNVVVVVVFLTRRLVLDLLLFQLTGGCERIRSRMVLIQLL